MENAPNFASVTNIPCTCNYLQRSADNPLSAIIFDPQTSEYQIESHLPDGRVASRALIYHCPFCGGTAPASKRHLLFATVSREEEERLANLLKDITTLADAIGLFGNPDRETWKTLHQPEREGTPPTVERHRTIVYSQLSDVAEIWITKNDGKAHWQLQGKYLG